MKKAKKAAKKKRGSEKISRPKLRLAKKIGSIRMQVKPEIKQPKLLPDKTEPMK